MAESQLVGDEEDVDVLGEVEKLRGFVRTGQFQKAFNLLQNHLVRQRDEIGRSTMSIS